MREPVNRIIAMTARYCYLLRSSWPRLLEIAYWPTMQMLVWGFLYTFLYGNGSALANTAGMLLGAVLLWDVLFRSQIGLTFSFLEEVWSRNLANLMMSPLTATELAASLMAMSFIRLAIGTLPVAVLTSLLFSFNIFTIGLPLLGFFVNLVITSWAIGLVLSGLVVRTGLGAESYAYSIMILLLPLCCVYYPVWVLPAWLQPLAWALPPTYVFEGMRAVLVGGVFRPDLMLACLTLNVVYLCAGFGTFVLMLRDARRRGVLLTFGE